MNNQIKKLSEKFGANIAGLFYGIGNFLQLGLGIWALSIDEIVSAALNISAAFLMIFQGHKNWGIIIAYIFGTVAVTIAVWSSLAHYETGTIFGFTIFLLTQLFCIFSAPLTRAFQDARNKPLRLFLGHPRQTAGIMSVCLSRLPIIYENVVHQRWKLVAVFALWALGDLAVSVSKPDITKISHQS